MRALRIAALGLLPLAAGCWMEPPNLQSTGGGYTSDATARPAVGEEQGAVGTHEDPAETRPAPLSP